MLYRNLRDFLSLHAHYKAAGLSRVTNRSTAKGHVEVPEFPKSSSSLLQSFAFQSPFPFLNFVKPSTDPFFLYDDQASPTSNAKRTAAAIVNPVATQTTNESPPHLPLQARQPVTQWAWSVAALTSKILGVARREGRVCLGS